MSSDALRQRVESLFNEVVSIDTANRGEFLEEKCAGDSVLRAAVESMLAQHDDMTADFLEAPAGDADVLNAAHSGERATIKFIPHSGPFARGIYVTVQARLASNTNRDDVLQALESCYSNAEFVQVIDGTPKLKNVVASNYAQIGAAVSNDSVVVMCAIDNLVKGAAGGAIQWMNRLWSLPESSGLTSAPPAWT